MDAAVQVPESVDDAVDQAFDEAVGHAAQHRLIKFQAERLGVSPDQLTEQLNEDRHEFVAAATDEISTLRDLYRRRARLIDRSRSQAKHGPLSKLGSTPDSRQRSPHLLAIMPDWHGLDRSIRTVMEGLRTTFVEQAMVPSLRLWLNQRRQQQEERKWNYIRRLDEEVDTAELRSPVTWRSFVLTERLKALGRLLARMPGGSIGVAGPRGSGKSTAIDNVELVMASAKRKCQLFQVRVSAPVEYVPREFLLHLYDEICTAWLKRHGVSANAARHPDDGPQLRRLWALATVAAPALLAGTGIAVWLLTGLGSVDGLQSVGSALPLVFALLAIAGAAGLGIWMARRLRFEERFSHPYFDQPQAYFSFRIHNWSASTATKYAAVTAGAIVLLSTLTLLYASGRIEWLDARRASGLALLVVAALSFLTWLTLAVRLTIRSRASATQYSKIFVLTALLAVSLSLGLQGTGLLLPGSMFAPTAALVAGGGLIAAAGSLVGLRTAPPAAISGGPDFAVRSVAMALRDRQRLRYQRTRASGWTAGTKIGSGSYLPVVVEVGSMESVSDVEHPLSVPEITHLMRELLMQIRRENTAADFKIVICIDELDKLEGEEGAKTFLNEIKGVFTISNVLFIVSVSEDAMASFERRGLAFRDVFDSAFDEIIHVPQLSLHETTDLVGKRISNVPRPFVALAHCLSAGLARDVIRALDHMTDTPAPQDLASVTRAVVHREIRGKWQAVVSAVRPIPLEPQVTDMLKVLYAIDRCPGVESVEGRCLARDDAFADPPSLRLAVPRSPELEHFRTLQRLGGEYLGFTYFCRTLVDLFDFDREGALDQFIDAEQADRLERNSIEYLASARQHLGVNPRLAWEQISFFREAHLMSAVRFPAALMGSPDSARPAAAEPAGLLTRTRS